MGEERLAVDRLANYNGDYRAAVCGIARLTQIHLISTTHDATCKLKHHSRLL